MTKNMWKIWLVLIFLVGAFGQAQGQTKTPNLGLVLPPAAPGSWGEDLNNNLILLDTVVAGAGSGDLTELQGTANEITVTSGTGPVPIISLPATVNLSSKALLIPGKTTATAPTAAGSVARLTDGGAAGAIVMGDGTNATCGEQKSLKIVIVTCPPFNAIGDGTSHPLSERFASLGAAQAVYPFITSLTQQIDYAALKLASNTALGADGSENASANQHLNKPIYIPAGNYQFGNDTWTIRNAVGIYISGAGRLSTSIHSNNSVLKFDGLWYSRIEKLSLESETTGAVAVLEIDGNVPGHAYTTRGVQANTFADMLIDAGGSTYGIAMTRLGNGDGAPGAQGSENSFNNVHFSNASEALYLQTGANALANTFYGGNFQSYPKHGIYSAGAAVNVIGTGFQSTYGYAQIVNDGWDISLGHFGALEGSIIHGTRTESLRFLWNEGAATVDVRAATGNVALSAWIASSAYSSVAVLGEAIRVLPAGDTTHYRMYRATTPGTSGSSEPTWPLDGSTVADGTVVWTEVIFDSIINIKGTVDLHTVHMELGSFRVQGKQREVHRTTDYTILPTDDLVTVDATGGAVTVTLPETVRNSLGAGALGLATGQQITIKKVDTSANTVTVHFDGGTSIEGGLQDLVIAGGSRGYVTLAYGTGVAGVRVWSIVNDACPTCETTTGAQTKVDTHVNDATAAHAASAISFTPNGSIAATTVQAAIQEVRDEATGGGGTTLTDSASLAAALSNETGTGLAVFNTTPTLVTPVLGAASATTLSLAAGAVGTPSLLFSGATNTGIYQRSSERITLSINNYNIAEFSGGGGSESLNLAAPTSIQWSSAGAGNTGGDLYLLRDAAGILAQRNGANAQTQRVYGTWTDASNYERASLSHVTGTGVTLAAQTAGTGGDNLDITLTPAGTGKVNSPTINATTGFQVGGAALNYSHLAGAPNKSAQVSVFDPTVAVTTGDGLAYFVIPPSMNGMNLVGVRAHVNTVSSSGAVTVDLTRCAVVATGNTCSGTVSDMLSTNLTIDANESKSATAAAAAVIDAANDDVAVDQVIRIDVDGAGTGTLGLIMLMEFANP